MRFHLRGSVRLRAAGSDAGPQAPAQLREKDDFLPAANGAFSPSLFFSELRWDPFGDSSAPVPRLRLRGLERACAPERAGAGWGASRLEALFRFGELSVLCGL